MHPNENPALVLVTPLLNGSNYHSWSRSMTVAIRSKNKLQFSNLSSLLYYYIISLSCVYIILIFDFFFVFRERYSLAAHFWHGD
jgi:hypothetical protein